MTGQSPLGLSDFAGRWQLDRSITDHDAGRSGRFEGTAEFSPEGNGLCYVERGLLYLPGQPPFQATRRYHWRMENCAFHIAFDDGSPFHSFDAANPSATHWCDPDTYAVSYDFSGWPVWRSAWEVTGPRKAYQMVNTYRRDDMRDH